ncbi:hypothetical protein EWM64_g5661 [Hericium alpestre]|uniref:Uncharacterized protein n=1 Tax=Hericium alpestre TaxID=135208 RepID=A0A4Y9ZW10_9AGAM|nr:hypothetical protein EWM64_g5661 [Hericium alpestre]
METSDDEPEPSISDTGKGKGKAVDRVPDDAYMAPSAKEDKRSAVSIMFLCELNLQREDGQTVGTRVPMETRAFDFDEPIDNVLNAFVEAFNEESAQWTNLYSGRKLERGDKVLFVFKNGAKIPSSFYCSSVGTFWNTFSEVSDRYFPEKDIQSRTVHIVMLVSDELVTERTPKNALAPKKPEKRKVLETCQRPPPAKREKVAEHHVAVKTEPVEAAVPPQKPAPVPHATASQLQLPTEGNQRARSQSNAAVSERPLDTAKKPAAQGNAIVKQEDVADGTIPTIKIVEPAFAPKNGTTENSGTTIATGPPDGTGKGKAPAQVFEGAERRTSPRPGHPHGLARARALRGVFGLQTGGIAPGIGRAPGPLLAADVPRSVSGLQTGGRAARTALHGHGHDRARLLAVLHRLCPLLVTLPLVPALVSRKRRNCNLRNARSICAQGHGSPKDT